MYGTYSALSAQAHLHLSESGLLWGDAIANENCEQVIGQLSCVRATISPPLAPILLLLLLLLLLPPLLL